MNETNWNKWLNDLATTDALQCQETLAQEMFLPNDSDDGVNYDVSLGMGYCCLGKGSVLMPGWDVDRLGLIMQSEFGHFDALAPREFIEWLGLDIPEEASQQTETGCDITLDCTWLPRGGDRKPVTAAWLNDNGFTFKQIADLFRHFGPGKVIVS